MLHFSGFSFFLFLNDIPLTRFDRSRCASNKNHAKVRLRTGDIGHRRRMVKNRRYSSG
jgi:hypothetical protein